MRSEIDEINLTAFALGELEGAEHAAVEARLAASPADRQYVEDVRAAAELVSSELARESSAGLDAIQLAAIEMRLRQGDEVVHRVDRRAVVRGRVGLGLSVAASVTIVCVTIAFTLTRLYRHNEVATHLPATEPASQPILIPFEQLGPEGAPAIRGVARPPGAASPFVSVADQPTSSFFVNTDTASYEDLRRALFNDRLPSPETIRTEGMINAFAYDYARPVGAAAFAGNVEIGPCPWHGEHLLARVAIKARDGAGAVAEDVRTEVTFDRTVAASYRLIGYETAGAGAASGGETVAGGQAATALYEVSPLPAAGTKDLLTLRVRYRDPGSPVEQTVQFVGRVQAPDRVASADFRFAAALAEFGMLLRDTPDRGHGGINDVIALAESGRGADPHGQRAQFIELVRRAKDLLG